MTKEEVLHIHGFFKQRNMKVIKISLLLDIIIVQRESGTKQKYSLKNFRNSKIIRGEYK